MSPAVKTPSWLRWTLMGAVCAFALAAGIYFGRDAGESRSRTAVDAGPLLALTLPDDMGRDQPIGQWKGKVLVINFWATWCVPCREEMPEFVKVQSELGARGLQFVGIAIDQVDKVKAFAGELGLNYPALIGGYGAIELSKTLGNRVGALPFTVIVDRKGNVAHTQLGLLKESKLRSIVDGLL